MRKFTELGRVVYDRKFHPFSKKDLLRIAKKNPPGVSTIAVSKETLRQLLYWYFWYGSPDPGEPIDFGGGEFGGGGATRVFDETKETPEQMLASDVLVFYNYNVETGRNP